MAITGNVSSMFNTSEHHFLSDDCEACQFMSRASYLMQIPIHEMTRLKSDELEQFSSRQALIVCANRFDELKRFDKAAIRSQVLVLQHELNAALQSDYPILEAPFTIYQFSAALSGVSRTYDDTERSHPKLSALVGETPIMQQLKNMISHVAPYNTNVLILGESGVGKDVVANCIHHLSTRKDKAFVPVNCGAIPSELIESELFGHEKGAFTGAQVRRAGRFELANTGSLFLDEIGDMPYAMQVKLLRVLQDKKIERVGSVTALDVDVRLIAATNKNLEQEVAAHRFREDLFYRLNVFPIYVPSLREHADDIPLLIENHLAKIHARLQITVSFSNESLAILKGYPWPGNIRELANFLERMVVLYPNQIISPAQIEAKYHSSVKLHSEVVKEEHEELEEALF